MLPEEMAFQETGRGLSLLKTAATSCSAIFGPSLIGLYAHGSLAFGCFRWKRSDLDFLIVTRGEPEQPKKEALILALLALWDQSPPKGLEMSALRLEDCRNFTYPTPYYLHLSPMHLARCRTDISGYCREMRGTDPDLAAHLAVARERGIALYGPPAEAVFGPVPRAALLDSIRRDVTGTEGAPTDRILNLCRALACAEDGLLLSKKDGARWALLRLPEYADVITAAASLYAGGDADLPAGDVRRFLSQALDRFLRAV